MSKGWEYKIEIAEARSAAEDLIYDLGIEKIPVDPFSVCDELNIQVVSASDIGEEMPEGVAASTLYTGDRFYVVLCEGGNEGFRNFTLSHEIGHVAIPSHQKLFTGNQRHYSGNAFFSKSTGWAERQADHFAASFLMPSSICKPFVNGFSDDDAGLTVIRALAKECKVSITAAAIRYAELTSHLAAIIVSSHGDVEYCVRSSELVGLLGWHAFLKKGSRIPAHSPAAKLNEVASHGEEFCVLDSGDIRWTDWFGEKVNNGEVYEESLSLGYASKVLTILTSNDF